MLSLFSFVQLLVVVRGLVPVLNRRCSKGCFTTLYLLQLRPYVSSFLQRYVMFGSRTLDMMLSKESFLCGATQRKSSDHQRCARGNRQTWNIIPPFQPTFILLIWEVPAWNPHPTLVRLSIRAPMQATGCESSTSSPAQLSSPQDSTPAALTGH